MLKVVESKAKLCIATSVYRLRNTRPLEYYLIPAIHLLEDLSGSNVHVCLFTNLSPALFPKSENIEIIAVPPESFVEEMWGVVDWRRQYQTALADRPDDRFEEKLVPELISIWLGKLVMMEYAARKAEAVLWQDSGIRMGRVFGKDFSKYTRCKIDPVRYESVTANLLSKFSMIFMRCDGCVNPYHGIDMEKYGSCGYQVRAGFILARADEIKLLKERVKSYWRLLIDNGDYGTEENPLTLYHWERGDLGLLSYDEWLSRLQLWTSHRVLAV